MTHSYTFFYFASNQIVKDLRRQTSDPLSKPTERLIRCRPRKPKWIWFAEHGKTASINSWGI